MCNSGSPCWCTGTSRSPVCIPGGRLSTYTCYWTWTTAFVRHRHVPSAASQHSSWQSLIRCCWTSSIEQSDNLAVRVGHYTRTVSTSTQNVSVWLLTAAAPNDSAFMHCVQIFLHTYLYCNCLQLRMIHLPPVTLLV